MINLGAILKSEIRRLARREARSLTGKTKHTVAEYRRVIAKLKRQLREQGKKVAFLEAQERKRLAQLELPKGPVEGARYSARSVRAQRARLRLSAEQFARLVGVSPLTIYNWEHGKARPRRAQFAALVALRRIGRREALAKLELLKAKAQRKARKGRRRGKG